MSINATEYGIAITLVLLSIALFFMYVCGNIIDQNTQQKYEHLTIDSAANIEGINNMASMYKNGTASLTNLNVTDTANIQKLQVDGNMMKINKGGIVSGDIDPGVNLTQDLGLYQTKPGIWIRYSVDKAQHAWYVDGKGLDATGATPAMALSDNGLNLSNGILTATNGGKIGKAELDKEGKINAPGGGIFGNIEFNADGTIISKKNGKRCNWNNGENPFTKNQTGWKGGETNLDECIKYCKGNNFVAEIMKEKENDNPAGCRCKSACQGPLRDDPRFDTALLY